MYKGIDIKLKSAKSMETSHGVAFNCIIVYKGKAIAFFEQAGRGGCDDIDILGNGDPLFRKNPEYIENERLFNELEEEVKKLPPFESELFEEGLPYDVGVLVAEILDERDKEKERKRNEKKGIVLSDKTIGWGITIATMMKKHSKKNIIEVLETEIGNLSQKEIEDIQNKEYLISIGVNKDCFKSKEEI